MPKSEFGYVQKYILELWNVQFLQGQAAPGTATMAPSIRRTGINLSHVIRENYIAVDAIE